MTGPFDWSQRYQQLIARLPEYVAAARTTLCGFSACVDVYLSLRDLDRVCQTDRNESAAALLAELTSRAVRGAGGEFAMTWPGGPEWMARNMHGRLALGGTGAQAANLLATLGAPALLSLADHSADQLSVIHPDVLVATEREVVRSGDLVAAGQGSTPHYIFEFTAGQTVGGKVLQRSSRVIVRFTDSSLQHDRGFERVSRDQAATAGAGILSGFNELPPVEAAAEYAYAAGMADAWRERGLGVIHLELGEFPTSAWRDEALADLAPAATSFGVNLSELNDLLPGDEAPAQRAIHVAEKFDFSRFCVHADEWAVTVTRGDPEKELDAILMGCLVAAVRAEAGMIVVPRRLPLAARLSEPPFAAISGQGEWSIVCCPSPYLKHPAAAIGLGDTFLAGTLLVLGGQAGPLHTGIAGGQGERASPP